MRNGYKKTGILVEKQRWLKIAKGRDPQSLPLLKNMNTKRYKDTIIDNQSKQNGLFSFCNCCNYMRHRLKISFPLRGIFCNIRKSFYVFVLIICLICNVAK